MRKNLALLGTLLACLGTGCASTNWSKPGASQIETLELWKECSAVVESAREAFENQVPTYDERYERWSVVVTVNYVRLRQECLAGKGFHADVKD
jgi:hypothetical protein